MNLSDFVPFGDLPQIIAFLVATIISPLLAIVALIIGFFLVSLDRTIFVGAVLGMAYQGLNIAVQWDAMPAGALSVFFRSGLIGSALAGILWILAGFGLRALFWPRKVGSDT